MRPLLAELFSLSTRLGLGSLSFKCHWFRYIFSLAPTMRIVVRLVPMRPNAFLLEQKKVRSGSPE